MTSRLIHSEHTRRQLAAEQAKHAAKCTRIVQKCIICREHFGMTQGHTS